MDIMSAKLGANMAKADLIANGQIGSCEVKEEWRLVCDDYLTFSASVEWDGAIVEGATYKAIVNGTEYIAVAFISNRGNDYPTVDFGDFLYIYFWDFPAVLCEVADWDLEGVPAQVYVLETKETIHPIDPKFIPWDSAPGDSNNGACLPVIELTTPLETGVTLTEEESAALTAVYESEIPVAVVKAPFVWGTGGITWDTAFIAEKGLLTQGSDILSAQVGGFDGATQKIEFDRNYKTGLWSVTVEKIGSNSLPVVNDCSIDLYSNSGTLDSTNSNKVRAAYNNGLPVVVEGKCQSYNPETGEPITLNYAILFQTDFFNGKMYAQYNDMRITISGLNGSGNCPYTVTLE